MGYCKKKPNRGLGVENMEFAGVSKKKHLEFAGIIYLKMKCNFHPRVTKKKQCGISRAEVLVFGLFELPRDLTQFCGISWGKVKK